MVGTTAEVTLVGEIGNKKLERGRIPETHLNVYMAEVRDG
jgi:hypothetical protein